MRFVRDRYTVRRLRNARDCTARELRVAAARVLTRACVRGSERTRGGAAGERARGKKAKRNQLFAALLERDRRRFSSLARTCHRLR
jgi:hypothetical protein